MVVSICLSMTLVTPTFHSFAQVPAALEKVSAASLAATLDLAGVPNPAEVATVAAAPTPEAQAAAQAATDAAAAAQEAAPPRLGERHKLIVQLQVCRGGGRLGGSRRGQRGKGRKQERAEGHGVGHGVGHC